MTGLRDLRCCLSFWDSSSESDGTLDPEAKWIQPILKVRGPTNADVAILTYKMGCQQRDNTLQAKKLRRHLENICTRPRPKIQ